MGPEFCCEKFKEERESECIKQDTEIFKYSGDQKGVYYLMFGRNIASAPLVLSILREEIGCCPES
jgi:hypothetical protein